MPITNKRNSISSRSVREDVIVGAPWGFREEFDLIIPGLDSQKPREWLLNRIDDITAEGYLEPMTEPLGDIWENIEQGGTEAIAFYMPFHYDHQPLPWGIYFYRNRVEALAHKIMSSHSAPFRNAMNSLIRLVTHHELFHFSVELFATNIERITNSAIYCPYSHYVYNHPSTDACHPVEEALANTSAFFNFMKEGWFDYVFDEQWVRQFLSRQPNGYCDWISYSTRRQFASGRRFLETSIMRNEIDPAPPFYPYAVPLPYTNFDIRRMYNDDFNKVPRRWFPAFYTI